MDLTLAGLAVGFLLGVTVVLAMLLVFRRGRGGLGDGGSVREVEGDVNVLGGLVLPVPDDVRWRGRQLVMRFGGANPAFIEVINECCLYIGGRQVPRSPRADLYCQAVVRAARRRRLEDLSRKVDEAVSSAELDSSGQESLGELLDLGPGGSTNPEYVVESGERGGPTGVSGGASIASAALDRAVADLREKLVKSEKGLARRMGRGR